MVSINVSKDKRKREQNTPLRNSLIRTPPPPRLPLVLLIHHLDILRLFLAVSTPDQALTKHLWRLLMEPVATRSIRVELVRRRKVDIKLDTLAVLVVLPLLSLFLVEWCVVRLMNELWSQGFRLGCVLVILIRDNNLWSLDVLRVILLGLIDL